jgi:hypothetical protein
VFDRFLDRYPAASGTPAGVWDPAGLSGVVGYSELAARVAGLPLGGGVFRIVSADEGAAASSFVTEGFPDFAARSIPFGVDWFGRVYAADRARATGLLLIEPGSGEAFEIDDDFAEFLDVTLVDEPELLELDLFGQWLAAGGTAPAEGTCVGFKLPLFLGGDTAMTNLELTDLDVYWSFSAQLRLQTRDLPGGTGIGRVRGE